MKKLLLLRHAKTEIEASSGSDHDRELTPRGRDDAEAIGKAIRRWELSLDAVLCSTAQRARQTAQLAVAKTRQNIDIAYHRELYLASAHVMRNVLAHISTGNTILIVAHNPGLEEWLRLLLGDTKLGPPLVPGTLAVLDFQEEAWAAVGQGRGQLVGLLPPAPLHKHHHQHS